MRSVRTGPAAGAELYGFSTCGLVGVGANRDDAVDVEAERFLELLVVRIGSLF